ncbi:MAG: molybdopterin-binding protein [Chloroflexota bacterium]
MPSPDAATPRNLETAELLAVGAELLVGDTRDTNSGDLARELTALGVEVARISDLPDRLDVVARALPRRCRTSTWWSRPVAWAQRPTT